MKESKGLNKWGKKQVHRLEDNIVKMTVFPKLIYTFNTTLTIIPNDFFAEIDKLILKFICKFKGHRIAETIVKENKIGGHISPILKPSNSALAGVAQ